MQRYANPTIPGEVIAATPNPSAVNELQRHGVKEGDLELAANTAKPSNVVYGIIFGLALLSFMFTLGATSTTMWMTQSNGLVRIGLAEACETRTTTATAALSDNDGTQDVPGCFEEDGGTKALEVTGPIQYEICRRYGVKPDNKQTLKVPGAIDKECYKAKKDYDAPKTEYDYVKTQFRDDDEKGASIVILGFCLAISVISNVLHFILVATCAVAAIVGFLHNCLPTGKLPPVLPIVSTGISLVVAAVCVLAQLALFVFFMGGPGTALDHDYGLGFYVAWMTVVLDVSIILLFILRLETRIRGCCAGRAHCCANCC
jgi:hypothetical protein